jgi:small-conductance mechanosensitive channel/CRP-like cAMP-binding protein
MRAAPVPPLGVPSYDITPDAWLHNALGEAWASFTPLLWAGLALAAFVRRKRGQQQGGRGVRGAAVLLILHACSLPLLGELAARGSAAYIDARLVSLALASFAGIDIALLLVFDGLLHGLGMRSPRILSDLIAALGYTVATFVLLTYRGVNLSGLIATSAVLTAVIGFSLQDTLGNIMGGIALQLENSVRVGDWIAVDDRIGRVVEIRWRQTTLETRNWETLVVPNSLLSKNRIVVLGRRTGEPLQWRRCVWFNVDFRYPPATVIAEVEGALRLGQIPNVATEPPPNCVLMDFDASFHRFAVRYWLTDLAVDDPTDSVVRQRILAALQRAEIPLSIPAQAVFVTKESQERKQRKQSHDLDRRRSALREVDLFEALPEAELDELARGLDYAPFAAGETITQQGSQGHHIYLVVSGRVGISVRTGEVEQQVATLEPGAFFGERSLMTGEPRNATAVAQTEVACFRLDKAVFHNVLVRRPQLADECAEILSRRESELSALRADLDRRAREAALADRRRKLGETIRGFFGISG